MWSRGLVATAILVAAPAGAGAGVIEGTVTYAAPVPVLPAIPVEAEHHGACGPDVPNDALAVDPATRGVRGAVVFLEDAPASPPLAPAPPPVLLENRGCRFAPRVVALRVGETLRIRNADPVLHNIRARLLEQPRSVLNVVQPTQGQETDREVKRSGILGVTCDAHPHMQGYLLAFDHPYFATTDARGGFRLPEVPAGTYRLVVWHPGVRVERIAGGRPLFEAPQVRAAAVTVAAEGTTRAALEIGEGR